MSASGHVSKKLDSKGRRRWYPVLELPRGEDGRRRQRWLPGHDTKKAADQALREVLGAADKGVFVEPSKETTGAFLTEWLSTIRTTVRPTTLASYESMILGHVVPRLGHVPLRELGPGHLNRFYGELLTEGRKSKCGGGLSPRTVRYVHVIVHRALKDATRWGKLVRNPSEFADPPRQERVDRSVWSAEQLRQFLGQIEASGERLAAAFHLAATTGMRRGEILGLSWSAIDLEAGRLRVVRTLVDVLYVPTFSEPKTARSRRSIALDPATVARLRRHRTAQVEERLAWGAAYRDDLDLVFACRTGPRSTRSRSQQRSTATCGRRSCRSVASTTYATLTPPLPWARACT